jgi:hypothetical protein
MADAVPPLCFVISPIGGDESQTRKWADQTIKHLIAPAVEGHGFKVLRADQDDRAGIITTHIIQRLVSAELVIADLTGRNPNVFYELAVRHVTRMPLIQIIRAEEEIPFDVQGMRTVKFELNDPDILARARDALERQVEAVLDEEEMETPISQAVGQQIAIESGDPQQVQMAELSRAIQSLTAEVRGQQARPVEFLTTGISGGRHSLQPGLSGVRLFNPSEKIEISPWKTTWPGSEDPVAANQEEDDQPSAPKRKRSKRTSKKKTDA